ncbi:MAG: MoaD/ThiS family protein [Gammaproteobacteria bacterium]|nr:MoaD/ThiS family protein [Gammaproteobacteria bacterium]
MAISVRYFATLREQLGRSEDRLETSGPVTAKAAWDQATDHQALPAQTLVAINMEYASRTDLVGDGDEVAFFPPVTGG